MAVTMKVRAPRSASAAQGFVHGHARRPRNPTLTDGQAVPHVQGDGDPLRAEARHEPLHERRVAQGRRADDRPGRPGGRAPPRRPPRRAARRPPRSDTPRPAAATIRATASVWRRAPSLAPSRSTTWIQRAPAATKPRATSTGSVP